MPILVDENGDMMYHGRTRAQIDALREETDDEYLNRIGIDEEPVIEEPVFINTTVMPTSGIVTNFGWDNAWRTVRIENFESPVIDRLNDRIDRLENQLARAVEVNQEQVNVIRNLEAARLMQESNMHDIELKVREIQDVLNRYYDIMLEKGRLF